jgi:2-oxo-4-hydroxy-4-carboxy-5-ureidoimidazoline decarboxylase
MTLEDLNTVDAATLGNALKDCCGSRAWVDRMIARRPFKDPSQLQTAADDAWWALSESDWLEAFAKHPKIGDTNAAGKWSAEEQRGMDHAASDTARLMQDLNRAYLEKFGWIFIICASGKSADEMKNQLEQRLTNDPAAEIRLAAGEQAKITRLRLQKLLDS